MKDERMKKRFAGLLPIVLDLETGGVTCQTDAILEIAAISLQYNAEGKLERKDLFACHVEPFEGANLDPAALAINHIDPYHPFRFAIPEKEALEQLFDFVKKELQFTDCKRAVLVGHNAHFDLNFIQAAIKRCDIKSPFHAFTCLDTATLAGLMYKNTVLARAANAAGIPFDRNQAHSAIYDTEVTTKLFCKIVNRISQP